MTAAVWRQYDGGGKMAAVRRRWYNSGMTAAVWRRYTVWKGVEMPKNGKISESLEDDDDDDDD